MTKKKMAKYAPGSEWSMSRRKRHRFTVSWQEGHNNGQFTLQRELAKGDDVSEVLETAGPLGVTAEVYEGNGLSPLSPRNCRVLRISGPFTPAVLALTAITLAAAMQETPKKKTKTRKKA
jgi:hypothetical protein